MKKLTYNHLSSEERDKIAVLRAQGKSIREIARKLKRNPGTLSRELQRNKSPTYNVYLPHRAQQRAVNRKKESVQRERIRNPKIRAYIKRKLKLRWSPEIIANMLPKDMPGLSVSHEAVYQFIYDPDVRKEYNLVRFLVRSRYKRRLRGHSKKHSKSHIPSRVPITERPAEANDRQRYGDWEADTMVSRQSSAALGVALERKSRWVHLAKLSAKTSRAFRSAINRRLSRYPRHLRRTITYDNGSENTEHLEINKTLGTQSYFCAPFHSWEKGSVEHIAGLVRLFLPKKTDFATISKERLRHIEYLLNTRPRKCLDYRTPAEVFTSSVALRS